MSAKRVTIRQLADAAGVDTKTVERWLANPGRMPHPQHRWKAADFLGADEAVLWPGSLRNSIKVGAAREIMAAYPSLSAVPDRVWRTMIMDAHRAITLCGYAPYWLTWKVPDFADVLRAKAEAGCEIRVILGDPGMELVEQDERATGVPLTLTARIKQTLHLLQPLREVIGVRQTGMGFGRSVYRGDDVATADFWLHGHAGSDFPVLHLQRRHAGGWFDQLIRHTEALWEDAQPAYRLTEH